MSLKLNQKTLTLIKGAKVARLATVDPKSHPYVVPVVFVFHENSFFIPLDEKVKTVDPRKLKRVMNIEKNPNVTLLIDEYQTSNVPFEKRGARQDEFIQAIKKVWTDDVVEFNGEFYNISPSKIDPKPVQKPHPKILLGGFGPKTFERIANYADGYLSALAMPIPTFEQLISGFKQTVEKAGKNPEDFDISTLTFPQISEASSGNGERFPMTGTIEEVGGDIEKLKEIGVNRAILVEFAGDGYDVDKSIQVAKELKKFAD